MTTDLSQQFAGRYAVITGSTQGLGAATADLFQGANVAAIERLFRACKGAKEDGAHYFREIIITSESLFHVFLRSKKKPSEAAVIVCRNSANLGTVLVRARSCLRNIESSV